MAQEYNVAVQPDFLERQAKAQPIAALSELIWNALDAAATEVSVEFEPDKLGGMSKIIVRDNGLGIPFDDAPKFFGKLGGSWKKPGARTAQRDRFLHGQEGRGRFKAFSLGEVVDWKVAHDQDGNH
jgi:DNA topoisomerase VI subunit B